MSNVTCPECGGIAYLVGPGNQFYGPSYRCYAHGESNFGTETVKVTEEQRKLMYEEAAASKGLSASNAEAYRK